GFRDIFYTDLCGDIRGFIRLTPLEISLRATARGFESLPLRQNGALPQKGCVAKRKFCGTSFFTLNSKNESSMWNFRSVLGMQKPAHTTWMELSAEVFQFR